MTRAWRSPGVSEPNPAPINSDIGPLAATLQLLSLFPPHFLNSEVGDEPMMEFDVYENPFRDEIVTKKFEFSMPALIGSHASSRPTA